MSKRREQRESEGWELRGGSEESGSSGESNVCWTQQKGEVKHGTEPRAFTWQCLHFCQRHTSICDSFQLWLVTRSLHSPVTSQLGFQAVFKWPFYHRTLLLTDSDAERGCRSVCPGCGASLAACSRTARTRVPAHTCTEPVFPLRFRSCRGKTRRNLTPI